MPLLYVLCTISLAKQVPKVKICAASNLASMISHEHQPLTLTPCFSLRLSKFIWDHITVNDWWLLNTQLFTGTKFWTSDSKSELEAVYVYPDSLTLTTKRHHKIHHVKHTCVCMRERARTPPSLFQTWEAAELQLWSTGITEQYSQSESLCHSALCAWKHSGLKYGTGASPTQAAFMRKWLTGQAYANKSIHHPPTQTSHPNSQFRFHS